MRERTGTLTHRSESAEAGRAAQARPAAVARPRVRRLGLERGLALLLVLYLLSLPVMAHDIRAADEIEYFSYLRSLTFDHDLDFTDEYRHFYDRYPDKYTESGFKRTFLDEATPTGKRKNFGPIGTALLWSPFYAVGHVVALAARALGSPVAADGYSKPYIWAITFGSALEALAGLILSYLVARRLAGEWAAFWATLAIWLATPTIFYSHLAPGYSHAASLFAVSLLLYLWFRWRDAPTWGRWLLLGAAGGLVAMVREQDALFLAVPAVYAGIGALGDLRRRDWGGVMRAAAGVALLAVAAFAVFTPQLAVYKVLNGDFRPSSDVSGKMSLVPAHALNALFSPYNGLFFWSPILLAAVAGLVLLAWKHPRLGLALLAGFVLTCYINGAIKTWNTAGSFGARRFLNCTPLFVVGLAYGYDRLLRSRAPLLRALVPALTLLAVAWNGGLIVQFVLEYMNRAKMEWPRVFVNQLRLPGELPGIVRRFLTDRNSFYEQ